MVEIFILCAVEICGEAVEGGVDRALHETRWSGGLRKRRLETGELDI